jgi:PKD repeat protein
MHTDRASRFSRLAALAAAILAAASCTVSKTPAPPLQGPSELGLSLTITASPDVLSMDGASQSKITIEARDANGQLLPNLQLRAEIMANGQLVDFGSLSGKSVVTGSNGKATVTYTAPTGVAGSAIPSVNIVVSPAGTDTNAGFGCITSGLCNGRFVGIRLVMPGVILGPGPTPAFTVTPASPTAFSDALLDASTSVASAGTAIVNYAWNFGDGSSGSGVTATHRFPAGSWLVTLTTTDNSGASASTSKQVTVGAGAAPTADFSFSPAAPSTNTQVNFNGGLSKAGAGHSIVRYDWAFGSGSPQSGITVSKTYDTAGTYNVTLTVTDEAGQTAITTKGVTVSAGGPTAEFTMSPTNPTTATLIHFDGNSSRPGNGASITTYTWDFGDNSAIVSGSSATASHQYGAAGTYVIRLTITDSLNQTSTVTHTLQVN